MAKKIMEDIGIIKKVIDGFGKRKEEPKRVEKAKPIKIEKKPQRIVEDAVGIDAEIIDARVRKISDIWRRKPGGLSFSDTDAVIVTAKTTNGNIVKETFYTCIKPDGTFNMKSLSHASQARRKRLADFLIQYGMTKNIEDYNVLQRINEWKGKHVEVILSKDGGYINVTRRF